MEQVQAIVYGLVPSIGIGFLFYKVMKAILEGDRNERLAHSRWEAEQDALRAREDSAANDTTGDAFAQTTGPQAEGTRFPAN